MKKIVALVLCFMMVCSISMASYASATTYYKWKSTRKTHYCSTAISEVGGANNKNRVLQVKASSVGKSNDSKTKSKTTKSKLLPGISIKDSRDSVKYTFHDTAIYDGSGWYGQSCYVSGDCTTTQTRCI